MKRKTRAQLEREIIELKAQLTPTYHYASKALEKASTDHLMASGALLQLTALGGRELISPVVIRDGLSPEAIKALQEDLKRSYALSTLYKL